MISEATAMRAIILAAAEDMKPGLSEIVMKHEARLAERFIQQPTEEDLTAYSMAIAIVAAKVEELMVNAGRAIQKGENLPAPIEVDLQPTVEQYEAGIKELRGNMSCGDMSDDDVGDVVTFVWQAMIGARAK